MDAEDRVRRLKSFALGGLLGASAAMATVRRRRRRRKGGPVGLAAFEGAPCYQETLEERSK
ncbi:MAG: hypothetical protein H0V79_11460 [Actinobacteria bacterium]|nr:hypothetical protein [Actinomycetota bacterium]